MEPNGIFKIRAETVLMLMRRFSITEEEVISELSLIIEKFVKIEHKPLRFNARDWNTRTYKSFFREQEIKVCLSKSRYAEDFVCVRVSVPKYSGDRSYELLTLKEKGKTYARDQLEKALEVF